MSVLAKWHEVAEKQDLAGLETLVAEDCVFYSPVVHTPQAGKALTMLYLAAAMDVLGGEGFRYVSEVSDSHRAVLEFETEIDGIQINGVDMFTWNDEGRIDSFKVMVRPLKAINLLHARMKAMLEQMAAGADTAAT
jgi:hypothetical protein